MGREMLHWRNGVGHERDERKKKGKRDRERGRMINEVGREGF